MLQKIIYIALHYLLLMVFVFSCWGIGCWTLQRTLKQAQDGLVNGLAIALGMGVVICLLQWLGIAGKLHLPWILVILGIGLATGFMQIYQLRSVRHARRGGAMIDGCF